MPLLRTLIRSLLYLPYAYRRLTGTGPFSGQVAGAVDLSRQQPHTPLQAALWRHHVKQLHASSCSVASIAACLNAIREIQAPAAPPISQAELLTRVRTANWPQRMSDQGDQGRRGLPLFLLGRIVEDSLAAFDLSTTAVETIQASRDPDRAPGIRHELELLLNRFETDGDCLLIAHFDQGAFLPALNIPHISPVGSFDATGRRVVILDVDPELAHPYTIDLDTFYQGVSCNVLHLFKPFGYGSGGYVAITL